MKSNTVQSIGSEPSDADKDLLARHILGMTSWISDQNRERIETLLKQPGAADWLKSRTALFEPLQGTIPGPARKDLFGNAVPALVKVLYEARPDHLKKYVFDHLRDKLDGHNKDHDTPELFRERLNFIQTFVPPEALEAKGNPHLDRLLGARLPFLTSLHQALTPEKWREVCMNPEQTNLYASLQSGIKFYFNTLDANDYVNFSKRESTPLDAEKEVQDKVDELRDVLRATGFDRIANPITAKIRMVKPQEGWQCYGRTGGMYAEYPSAGEIHIGIGERKREYFLNILTHEVGHNLMHRLEHLPRGQEWFDRYAVSVISYSSPFSSYADSYRFTDGDNSSKNKVDSSKFSFYKFAVESFAEEFRLYWQRPETLPQDRLKIFDEICDDLFPKVDRDDMRKKMRSTLGNYYGKSVADVTEPTACGNAKAIARKNDRVSSEKNRERLKKIISEMTKAELWYWLVGIPAHDYKLPKKTSRSIELLFYGIRGGEFDQDVVFAQISETLKKKG